MQTRDLKEAADLLVEASELLALRDRSSLPPR